MRIKAIHTIQRDPKAKPPVVYPGEEADLNGEEAEFVLSVGAAVAVETEEEAAAPKSKAELKAEAKAAKQAEADAAKQAEADAAKQAEADAAKQAEGADQVDGALV